MTQNWGGQLWQKQWTNSNLGQSKLSNKKSIYILKYKVIIMTIKIMR